MFSGALFAQEKIDENALFADSSSVVDSAKVVNTKEAAVAAEDKKSVSFSGSVNAYATPGVSRSWFDKPNVKGIGFSSLIVGDALFDARLVDGVKAFADMEASYTPAGSAIPLAAQRGLKPDSGGQFLLREMFVDANYNKLVYVRAGKQVLQWGRCNLWNPTDFINVDRKTFLQRIGNQEGTYGIKLHIPYKTLFNFYSFIDANDASSLQASRCRSSWRRCSGAPKWRPPFGNATGCSRCSVMTFPRSFSTCLFPAR